MANISADIYDFEYQQYLVSVDHYSKLQEVANLPGLSSNATIQRLSPNLQEMDYLIEFLLTTDHSLAAKSSETSARHTILFM